ncbi:hypothetical protein ACROYT_G042477 [Oculina patagonica]
MLEITEDDDLAYALSLQEELNREQKEEESSYKSVVPSSSKNAAPVSVVDESWELIDPIPDIRQLFLQFNDVYFKGLLGSVEVKWSPRMTLCAGLCCYEGRGGLCSIRLSAPLLKLRPRKDLVQTLLHEMIHALLFVTQNNKDHDGHGPEFLKQMHRINAESGANITVYHNFHDEVNVYRQHWWKCDGPCQKRPPYYGIVRRAMNRAPSPRDTWWADHQRTCGGTYTKIKEPENYGAKKTSKSKQGKGEAESGTAKGKGQVLSGSDSGTLPKFFKRKARDSDSGSINSDTDHETGKKRKKGLSDDSGSAPSINSEASKSKTSQPGSSRWASDVIPFSGPGRTLSSNSGVQNSDKRPLLKQEDFKITSKEKNNGTKKPVIVIETPSPTKPKNTSPTLTIMDAFQRAKDKNKNCEKRSDSLTSPLLGSQGKPIELLDSPSSAMREVASSGSDSMSTESVQCPVCQTFIPNCKINQHLDSCLKL